jgi:hypothetical protein
LIEIKIERFDVGSRSQGEFVLQHNLWDKQLEVKWNLVNVYGAAQTERKEPFLAELASFCSKIIEPYLIGGDFNIVRFSLEKNINLNPNRFSKIFNTIININELSEVFISGGIYTWSNNYDNPTPEKLDRIMMSKERETLFPTVHVYKIPRGLTIIPLSLLNKFPRVRTENSDS